MDKRKKGSNQRGKNYQKGKSTLSSKVTRQLCDCEATKHPLVNNCLSCGRIICSSEGQGPCLFCGSVLAFGDDTFMFQSSKNSNSNGKGIYQSDPTETLKLRNKLLEFDKNCASRTSVIDDECDYYQTNNTWLTKEQREKWEQLESDVHESKHRSRLLQKLTMDFTGRVHTKQEDPLELFNKMNSIQDERNFLSSSYSNNNHFEPLKGPVYISDNHLPSNTNEKEDAINSGNRIQDKAFLEISDKGVCLSMHQPYASLLVRGIKKTEGRTWYSSHRGRLWIASTVREPKAEEIATLEEMHRLEDGDKIDFPKTYPTGCLLGCVNVTDVLSQEEYEKVYPGKKVDSPFIFVCDNYFELPMKYPIQGKHKIYKLESVIHRAALNCLEKTSMQMSKNAR